MNTFLADRMPTNQFYLCGTVDPKLVQGLSGIPLFFSDLAYYPVEFFDTKKRDAVRGDLLTPISDMEALALAAK